MFKLSKELLQLKIVTDANMVEVMGPYECQHCGYHFCIDATFDELVGPQIACPGCSVISFSPQEESPFIVKFEPAQY